MPIDPKYIRDHYASLTDDALLGLERADLTTEAQKIFDTEVRRRGLDYDEARKDASQTTLETPWFGSSDEEEPADEESENDSDWMEHAFTVTTFSETASGSTHAANALAALRAAGIPCEITQHEVDPAEEPVGPPYREYRVLVPPGLGMQATSVLDIAIFNESFEADWSTQLESLSDEELRSVDIETLCAGLLDRAERLRNAYKRAVAKRL